MWGAPFLQEAQPGQVCTHMSGFPPFRMRSESKQGQIDTCFHQHSFVTSPDTTRGNEGVSVELARCFQISENLDRREIGLHPLCQASGLFGDIGRPTSPIDHVAPERPRKPGVFLMPRPCPLAEIHRADSPAGMCICKNPI